MTAQPTDPLAGLDRYLSEAQACRDLAARLRAEHPELPVHHYELDNVTDGASGLHPRLHVHADVHDTSAVLPWAALFGTAVSEDAGGGDRHVSTEAVVGGVRVRVWVCVLAPLAVAS